MDLRIILRYARKRILEKLEQKPDAKLKLKLDGRQIEVSFSDMLETIDRYITAEESDKLHIVTNCRECKHWTGGYRSKSGCCFPKDFTSSRDAADFCSRAHKRETESEREHPWTKKTPE